MLEHKTVSRKARKVRKERPHNKAPEISEPNRPRAMRLAQIDAQTNTNLRDIRGIRDIRDFPDMRETRAVSIKLIQPFPFSNGAPVKAERGFVGELAVIVVRLERIDIARVVVGQTVEDGRVAVHREIADLDDKDDIRQAVGPKFDAAFLEMLQTQLDTVIGHGRIVEKNGTIVGHHVETEFEIGQHCLVRVLAVDKADIDLGVDPRAVDVACAAVDGRDLVGHGDFREIFEHSRRRVVEVSVIEPACIRLYLRPFIDREYVITSRIEQIRLDAAAEI